MDAEADDQADDQADARPAGRAGEVYVVALEPPGSGRGRLRAAGHGALLAVGAMAGWYDEPSVGDLVVRRRADGRELLRTDAGPSGAATRLLAHVQRQLAVLTPRELRDTWGALDPGAGAEPPAPGEGRT